MDPFPAIGDASVEHEFVVALRQHDVTPHSIAGLATETAALGGVRAAARAQRYQRTPSPEDLLAIRGDLHQVRSLNPSYPSLAELERTLPPE